MTIAGDLPAKFVIHAVGPRWLDGTKDEPQLLCDTYSNALLRAEKITAKTVSFPNISTGIYSFPPQLAAEIAIGTVLSTLMTYRTVEHVFFVSKEREHYETYRNILLQLEDPHIDILL
ncbi:macro domain-containing protein [Acinetobacter portensis]|uniref:Macro domain-containing protein n=1 Tax=Acinetobacter portensis TaxID=1839785 RepID=A0ABY4JW68_9GAMM|nr:macro domain-containing protein [Acinetobacter portensis]MCK7609555.1 macro domain-containing protein [Acinetobacter portensis]MCK7640299.1 macro domain-containing protein [Acinetobacter portensis]UPO23206.1 macro domain-containing protein [Acinetobacter portensis]